jgi:hypothetical protein
MYAQFEQNMNLVSCIHQSLGAEQEANPAEASNRLAEP